MTGSSGVSGTLRPFDSITGASGILGRPVKPKPGDDTGRHPLTKSNTSLAFSAMMKSLWRDEIYQEITGINHV